MHCFFTIFNFIELKSKRSMKIKILFVGLLLIISCQSTEHNHIEITPKKTPNKIHVGQGVWMNIPSYFKKAKSYEGYQAPNSTASISVKSSNKSIEELKKSFEPAYLKKRKTVLLESSTVKYGDNENAFFTVVRDKRKETIRYFLAIAQGGRTYNIKAFYFENARDGYNLEIREALQSVFIGDHQEKEELFKLANLSNFDSIIYTRDGKHPTESADQAVVEIETKKSTRGITDKKLIESEARKITGKNLFSIEKDNLCLLYTSPSPRDQRGTRMPSSA